MSFDHELSYSDLQEISGLGGSYHQQTSITPTPARRGNLPRGVPHGLGRRPLAERSDGPVFRPGTPIPPMLPLGDNSATRTDVLYHNFLHHKTARNNRHQPYPSSSQINARIKKNHRFERFGDVYIQDMVLAGKAVERKRFVFSIPKTFGCLLMESRLGWGR